MLHWRKSATYIVRMRNKNWFKSKTKFHLIKALWRPKLMKIRVNVVHDNISDTTDLRSPPFCFFFELRFKVVAYHVHKDWINSCLNKKICFNKIFSFNMMLDILMCSNVTQWLWLYFSPIPSKGLKARCHKYSPNSCGIT